jgi:DNA-binding transcriptional regulator LsrR (DeoR family)
MARFGLRAATVVQAGADDADVAREVGTAGGHHLAQRLRDGLAIGVGWGATLNHAVAALGDVRATRLSVISLLGGMTHSRAVNPAAVARRMADALHADCYQLAAPLLVTQAATRDALWREPALADLRARARRSDVALVSVGDVSERATLSREGLLTPAELAGLARAGAVGDVLCQFIDARGALVEHEVNRRAMTAGLDALRGAQELVLASGGARKVPALRAALAALPVHVLVTDAAAATGLMAD